ncbi:AsmA family protein [Hafnia alvei]|uniref:AsmA family protein n=1 Tax=Hafnia alvei TaxID=569 RepID=A0ABD7PZK7_HAFAL|nr:AsmA family protein [Hafnia alvei]TBL41793.1 AsmA family protein [Hafnia alvei]TBL65179.1 AsmA family protein [Hafnia alvei]STQ73327.1 putative assembly protein [Hafnia alvei]
MTRTGKAFSWLAGILVVLIVGIVVFVMTFDWNRLKPTINKKVSTELNRPFAIRGDLGVDWARPTDETGWRSWVPWPHIHAEDIVLGNPPEIPAVSMVTLERVDASLAPLALLGKQVYIPRIKLKQPDASLRRLANGKNNWTFELANSSTDDQAKDQKSAWSFKIDDIVFDQGVIAYDDAIAHAKFKATVDPLGKPLPFSEVMGNSGAAKKVAGKKAPDYVFGWKVDGTYNGESLSGSGKIGGMLALRDPDGLFPLQADVRSGKTRVAVAGTLSDPLNLGALDLRLQFSGQSLSQLHKLTGIVLPDTPPYSTDGHLSAELKRAKGAIYRYQNFNGKIGDSDIHGSLTYQVSKPRPSLNGELVSNQLRFADLAPLIGADSNQEKVNRGDKATQPSDKVLPADKFDTKQWSTMDADVKFTAKRIEHGESLPLSDLYTHLVLNNGTLLMDPLRFGVAGGNLNSTIRLEGQRTPMRGMADLHARGFQLQKLLPNVESMRRSLGQLNGDAKISGTGNSVADLLGTSNGDVRLLINDGVISRNLMEIAGLNVGNYLVGKLFGDDEVKINCAAADIGIKNGLAATRLFVFDTENAVINISGNVNLATERMDLSVDPESKGMRVLTLRSPLYVKGTFKHPDAGVKAGPLIARGVAAVALGAVVAPAAALLALISPSDVDSNQCGGMLKGMKK